MDTNKDQQEIEALVDRTAKPWQVQEHNKAKVG